MKNNHPFNTICPYYTMFPVDFPNRILRNKKNKMVLDPFCGRGTTLFSARENGMPCIGIDSSIVAATISRAKLSFSTPSQVMNEFDDLLKKQKDVDLPQGEFWEYVYHHETLEILCKLRKALLESRKSNTRNILSALFLGALHGPLNKGSTPSSYLSNQMMRTFAAKPGYAVKFWKSKNMKAPYSDVRSVIERRAERLLIDLPETQNTSKVIHGDSRVKTSYQSIDEKIDIVITSPPYYGMQTYEQDQWLRMWFLGGPDYPNYQTKKQINHSGIESFTKDLSSVWDRISEKANKNLLMVIRFGVIGSKKVDHKELLKHSLNIAQAEWRITRIMNAGSSSDGKRQSLSMGKAGTSESISESDFYVRLN